jgi:hypothetical protein
LSCEERERLEALTHSGKSPAQLLTKARILLKADVSEAGEGWSDSAISAALDTSILGVLSSQCLSRRIPNKQILEREVTAWRATTVTPRPTGKLRQATSASGSRGSTPHFERLTRLARG